MKKIILLASLLVFSINTYASAQYFWVAQNNNHPNLVWGGYEPGRALGVCHTRYKDGMHPGKLIDGHKCHIGYGGKEIVQEHYEALAITGFYLWVPVRNGQLPARAVSGGQEPGRTLYICRTLVNGTLHPGKLVDQSCSVGYGGNEVMSNQYEVLTLPQY